MHKLIFLMLSQLLMMGTSIAATVKLHCPDGSKMQQSKQCAPEIGCWPAGVTLNMDGSIVKANIDSNGSIEIDDMYLGKVVSIQSKDNFWAPQYCTKLGSGILYYTFNLKKEQTITMNFQSH